MTPPAERLEDRLAEALRAASNAVGPCSSDLPLVRQIAAALAEYDRAAPPNGAVVTDELLRASTGLLDVLDEYYFVEEEAAAVAWFRLALTAALTSRAPGETP
jgi:hypothetical protein